MKNKKILKIILIIALIVIIIFVLHLIRNYIIISKIANMQESLFSITNFSYKIIPSSSNDETIGQTTERYYKDGKNIIILEQDDSRYMFWNDQNTDESITINLSQLTASVYSGKSIMSAGHMPTFLTETSTFAKLGLSAISFITTDEANEEECYVVRYGRTTNYISKENGILLKSINGATVSFEGKKYDTIEYTDWIFNELTDEDMSRPNLTGYTVTYEE